MSSRRPHGSKLGKASLASFKDPDIRQLTKLGHHQFHQHIATVEAFPFPVDKDELCWKVIQEGIAKEPGLQHALSKVENDQRMKERLLDYVSDFTNTDKLLTTLPGLGGSYPGQRGAGCKS